MRSCLVQPLQAWHAAAPARRMTRVWPILNNEEQHRKWPIEAWTLVSGVSCCACHVKVKLLGMGLNEVMDRRRSSGSGLSMGMAVTHNRLYDNAAAVQHRQDMRRVARCFYSATCYLCCLPAITTTV